MSLTSQLQKAYAGEVAAYHAYEGHWRSVKDPVVAKHIRAIQRQELQHIAEIKRSLKELGGNPNWVLIYLFWVIGKTVSALCYVSGQKLPMLGAAFIEYIGETNYRKMSKEAYDLGLFRLHYRLLSMAAVESAHKWYLESRVQ